jgi:hypothetical protein
MRASVMSFFSPSLRQPDGRTGVRAMRLGLRATKVRLHATKVGLPATKVRLPATKIRLHATKMGLHATIFRMHATISWMQGARTGCTRPRWGCTRRSSGCTRRSLGCREHVHAARDRVSAATALLRSVRPGSVCTPILRAEPPVRFARPLVHEDESLKSAWQNYRRPSVAQAFRPAHGRRAALKGCATGISFKIVDGSAALQGCRVAAATAAPLG